MQPWCTHGAKKILRAFRRCCAVTAQCVEAWAGNLASWNNTKRCVDAVFEIHALKARVEKLLNPLLNNTSRVAFLGSEK
jgi:hypothetical protein